MQVLDCGCHAVDRAGVVWSRWSRRPGTMRAIWRVVAGSVKRGCCTQVYLHGRSVLVNRLVANAFVPNPMGRPDVQHRNGNLLDNRADNLQWGNGRTRADRMAQLGRVVEGVRCHSAKLDPEQVRAVRRLRAAGMSYRALGRQFGLSPQTIFRCVVYRNWKSVA